MSSRPFALSLIATSASFFGYSLLLPLVPLWAVHGGARELSAGATTTVFMAATVFAQFMAPRLVRRTGYRATFALGAALLGAPAPLYALTSALPALLFVSAMRGAGFGLVSVCGSALVAELLPRSQLGRGSGTYGIAVGVPQLLGLPAGVWIANHWGFGPVFWLAGVLPVLACIPALSLPRIMESHEAPADATQGSARRLLTPGLVMLVAAVGYAGVVTFLPIALKDAQNVSAIVLFAVSAAMLAARWLSGVVGDRLQLAGRQLPVGLVIVTLGLVLIALATRIPPSQNGMLAALVATAGATLVGGGFGILQNDSLVAMFHRVDRSQYGFASAAWNMAYDAGTGSGAVALGALITHFGYATAFLAAALLVLVMLPSTLATR